jgi:hemoglobin-like flavoprotein
MKISVSEVDFPKAAKVFYESLFDLVLHLRERFRALGSQQQMFEIALKTVLKNKDNDQALDHYLHLLGEKHKMLGLQQIHMERGRVAFLYSIKEAAPTIGEDDVAELDQIFSKIIEKFGYKPTQSAS